MPVRVLLLNPNKCEEPYPVYPVALGYLRSALLDSGHEVAVWDATMSEETLADLLGRFDPEVVAVSVRNIDNVQLHNQQWFVADLVQVCEELRSLTKSPIVLGGSGFSLFPESVLKLTKADYGMVGDAEEVFVEWVDAYAAGRIRTDLPGLVWRSGENAVTVNPGSSCVHFVDRIPSHDETLLAAYVKAGSPIGVQTQRGCALKCCYCTYPLIEGRNMRRRSADSIANEVEQLAQRGVSYVFFVDSVFNLSSRHVIDICEALLAKPFKMSWGAFLRPHGIDAAMAELFRKSGMKHAEFGSDSFNDTVLKAYHKSFTFEDVERSHQILAAAGVHCSHFIIAGGPGETMETLRDTLEKSERLSGALYFAIVGMRVYPNTDLWRSHVEAGGSPDPDDYLAPVFYVAPGLEQEAVFAALRAHVRKVQNWVVGDPPEAFKIAVAKLRARGLKGPLWEYVDVLQRMMPAGSGQ